MKFLKKAAPASERRLGRIIEWNTDQGFGFVVHGGERWFLHIRGFLVRDLIPAKGDRVRFVPGVDPKGRPCAAEAELIHRRLRALAERGSAQSILLLLPVLALIILPTHAAVVAAWLLGMSLLTVWLYWLDKRASIRCRGRVPESTLHLMELAGGWPGALCAQHWFRHKTSKGAYQRVFWLVVLSHQLLAFDLLLFASGIWETAVTHLHLLAVL